MLRHLVLFMILIFFNISCFSSGKKKELPQSPLASGLPKSHGKAQHKAPFGEFTFIGDLLLPKQIQAHRFPLGGLSSLAFDPENNQFWAVSDDRAVKGPARFYRWPFKLSQEKGSKDRRPTFTASDLQVTLLKDGSAQKFPRMSVDFEGLALLKNHRFYLSSEANRSLVGGNPPKLTLHTKDGIQIDRLEIPEVFWDRQKKDHGFQSNKGFEGLTLSRDQNFLYAVNEKSLLQEKDTRLLRIQEFSLQEKKPSRQWTYRLEDLKGNGVTELLVLDEKRFLLLERAYLKKKDLTLVRLYLADCRQASDSSDMASLRAAQLRTCRKQLVLDTAKIIAQLDEKYRKIDNLEGMTWGPQLPEGGRWFFLISDSNFNDHQRNQLLAFHFRPNQ